MDNQIVKDMADLLEQIESQKCDVGVVIANARKLIKPKKIGGLREELFWFANVMEGVLQDNDHKGGWGNLHELELISKLQVELAELIKARLNGEQEDVIKECADIANYAMMIANNTRE